MSERFKVVPGQLGSRVFLMDSTFEEFYGRVAVFDTGQVVLAENIAAVLNHIEDDRAELETRVANLEQRLMLLSLTS